MISFLSREMSLLDVGEPILSASFTYKRFSPDETTSETVSSRDRDILRYVDLFITAPAGTLAFGTRPAALTTELDFFAGDFSALRVEGTQTPASFVAAVSSSAVSLSSQGIVSGRSRGEIAASLDAATPAHVSTGNISAAMAELIPMSAGADSRFEIAKKAVAKVRVNSRIVGDVVAKIASKRSSAASAAAFALSKTADAAQNAAIASGWVQDAPALSNGEFRLVTDIASSPTPSVAIIGFLVEKSEIGVTGASREVDATFIPAAKFISHRDQAVKYGARYRYLVKTVAKVTMPATCDGQFGVAETSCTSSGTSVDIVCTETSPPPPPADFTADLVSGVLMLSWSLPVNPTRDIRKFQVYKRATLREPFTLLSEIDFSETQFASQETPDRVIRVTQPQTSFADRNFRSGDVYAVACIDAHNMSSGYSSQLLCDISRGDLSVRRVVCAGCPKAYPNLFCEIDPFPDVIFESNSARCTVFFTPKHLRVSARNSRSERLVVTDSEGSYALQLVSLNALRARTTRIFVSDARS